MPQSGKRSLEKSRREARSHSACVSFRLSNLDSYGSSGRKSRRRLFLIWFALPGLVANSLYPDHHSQSLPNEIHAVAWACPNSMLPYSQHTPAQAGKRPAIPRVSCTVQAGLPAPILCVRLRAPVAARTAVPEAPVHKNSEPSTRKDEIRSPWEPRVIQPPSAKRAPGEG